MIHPFQPNHTNPQVHFLTSPMATSETLTAAVPTITTTTTSTQDTQQNNWANLPSDILTLLVRLIDLNIDVPRLRSVCSSWRKSLNLSEIPILPSSIPTPNIPTNHPSCHLIQSHFYLFTPLTPTTPPSPWLARMCPIGPNKFHLFDPFKTQNYFFSNPPISGKLNLLDCRPKKISTCWTLIHKSNQPGSKPVSKKVVGGWSVDSSFLFAILVQLETPSGLVFWRLHDTDWTKYEQTFLHNHRILDIAYLDGLFYAFDLPWWRIGVIDPKDCDLKMNFFQAPNVLDQYFDECFYLLVDDCKYLLQEVFLVTYNQRLCLVIFGTTLVNSYSNPKRTVMFVYALKLGEDIGDNTWERMQGLGDDTFFIGYDVCFSIPNVPQWKSNCVWLCTNPTTIMFNYRKPEGIVYITFAEFWHYLRMYDPNKEEKGIVPFGKLDKKKYNRLFFPPPDFVKWYRASDGKDEVILHDIK